MISLKVTGIKELIADLDRLKKGIERNKEMHISIKADENGYIERQCPNTKCKRIFKVFAEDWNQKIKPKHVAFCPYCNKKSNDISWNTKKQMQVIHQQVTSHLSQVITSMGRYYGNTHFSVSATKVLIATAKCSSCECRYQYIGASFYCPACGLKKINFEEEFDRLTRILEALDEITVNYDNDTKELFSRTIIENSLKELVEIFQSNSELLYLKLTPNIKLKTNVFQRLIDGSSLWSESPLKKSYSEIITPAELRNLTIAFQKRHILVHNQGEIDEEYIKRSGDKSHDVGMRVVVSKHDVLNSVNISRKLLRKLAELVIEGT